MTDVKPIQALDEITFSRDLVVTQIPSGEPVHIKKGITAHVTQTLGGHITVQVLELGVLARIAEKDMDALYPEGSEIPEKYKIEPESQHDIDAKLDEKEIWEALKACYDPEIPVNIVDLGLIYDLQIAPHDGGGKDISIKMTLTAQGCGMGGVIAGDAQAKIAKLPGVAHAQVDIVWEPPWNPSMISPSGKKLLGMEDD